MNTSCRRLDDVALWTILKSVDAATLQKCRRVSTQWNEEIYRLNDYTRKFEPNCLMFEIEGTSFELSIGEPNKTQSFEEDNFNSETIQRVLRHVSPPKTLLIFINSKTEVDSYEKMMNGTKKEWIAKIRELEVVCHNPELPLLKLVTPLGNCANLKSLSLSNYCNQTISLGDVFEMFPELENIRIFGFNSNDGSGCSSGLIFDDNAVEKLIKNQKEFRRIKNIELFNTDMTVSMEVITEALRSLAHSPSDPESEAKDSDSINFLFENCRWDSIEELNLLSSIIRISSQFNFPLPQPNVNVLKGDFKFSIFETNFVFKFMV
ncbi:unnamed protein product [Caenorhabditis brenneri]